MAELKSRPRPASPAAKRIEPQYPTDEISVALRALKESVANRRAEFTEKFEAFQVAVTPLAVVIIARRLQDPSLVSLRDDVLQEFFFKAIRPEFIKLYNPYNPGNQWVAAVIGNLALDCFRREKVRGKHIRVASAVFPESEGCLDSVESFSVDPRAIDPFKSLLRAEFSQRLRDIADETLSKISQDLRQAWELRHQGLKYKDIAVMAECPIGTVKSRINSVRVALSEAFLRAGIEPE